MLRWLLVLVACIAWLQSTGAANQHQPGTPESLPREWLTDPTGPLTDLPPDWQYSAKISTHYFTGHYYDRQSGASVEFRVGPREFFERRPCKSEPGMDVRRGKLEGTRYCEIRIQLYRHYTISSYTEEWPDFRVGSGNYPDLEVSLPTDEESYLGVVFFVDDLVYSFSAVYATGVQERRVRQLLLGEMRLADRIRYPR